MGDTHSMKTSRLVYFKWMLILGCLYMALFHTPLKFYILPPVWNWVVSLIETFFYVLWYIFMACSIILAGIVWWVRWADMRLKRRVTTYVSKLISPDYYKSSKSYDYDRAIETAMSKAPTGKLDAEDGYDDDAGIAAKKLEEQLKEKERQEQKEPVINYEEFEDLDPKNLSDGIHKQYFKNGKLKKEVSYKDGDLNGLYRLYYEDGTLRQEKSFINGKLDGIFKAYDDMGMLYFEIEYKDGKQHGIEKTYYRNGMIQYEDTYVEGRKVNRKTYSESGEMKSNYNFHQK